jgi:hypothetical protein
VTEVLPYLRGQYRPKDPARGAGDWRWDDFESNVNVCAFTLAHRAKVDGPPVLHVGVR